MKTIIVLLVWFITLSSCTTEIVSLDTGSLDIKVTIGPLCPTEPCNRPADDIKKVYESYSFVLTNAATKSVILEQKLSYNGTNGAFKSNNLAVGEYEMNINPSNIFTKRGFPKTVKIEKDKTTSLEIDIDTGIR